MDTPSSTKWGYLRQKPGSTYRQLFVQGRIAARTLYGVYVSAEEPRTAEQIAADWELPLEAVREAIAYCQSNPPEIQQDWEEEEALENNWILNDPSYYYPGIEDKRAQLLAQQKAGSSHRA
jgi:hypothetical protein